jgi:hypothetical protein
MRLTYNPPNLFRFNFSVLQAERTKTFSAFMDPEHSIPLMLPDGKLSDGVSLAHYLRDVPYYCLYDDVKCERPRDILDTRVPEAAAASTSIAGSLWNSIF